MRAACGPPRCLLSLSATGIPSPGAKWEKKHCYSTDFTLQYPTHQVENYTDADFRREKSQRRPSQVKLTFIAALEHSGTPSLYFPVINPQASGDQVIAPTPERVEQG